MLSDDFLQGILHQELLNIQNIVSIHRKNEREHDSDALLNNSIQNWIPFSRVDWLSLVCGLDCFVVIRILRQ